MVTRVGGQREVMGTKKDICYRLLRVDDSTEIFCCSIGLSVFG